MLWSGEIPLTAVQLLWVNLIMDTLGALALATEAPYPALMEKAPVGRQGNLITNVMWRNIWGQAIYQLTVLWTLQFQGERLLHLEGLVLKTVIFNSFVFCQVSF
jgi:Ca2+-transporting ATPase